MNFELENLFKFQKVITEMQSVCIGIADKSIREIAINRIDALLEIYKTFDKFYYQAHFNAQKVSMLQAQLLQAGEENLKLKAEVEKLLKSLEWQA